MSSEKMATIFGDREILDRPYAVLETLVFVHVRVGVYTRGWSWREGVRLRERGTNRCGSLTRRPMLALITND